MQYELVGVYQFYVVYLYVYVAKTYIWTFLGNFELLREVWEEACVGHRLEQWLNNTIPVTI